MDWTDQEVTAYVLRESSAAWRETTDFHEISSVLRILAVEKYCPRGRTIDLELIEVSSLTKEYQALIKSFS